MGLKKALREVDYYCLKQYGFSVFDKEVQEMIGVKKSASPNLRAISTARKMGYVIKDRKLSNLVTSTFLYIRADS